MKQEIIHQALSKVCNSKEFRNSPQNIKILEFLVEQAINEEFVKEHTLGLAVFGDKYDPDDSSSKVRVAMYKFRKKLEHYYAEEGLHETIDFIVKKGQYNLECINKQKQDHRKKNKTIALSAILGSVILVTALLLHQQKTPSFWNYFFASKSNNICYFSDQFVIAKVSHDGNYQFITSANINSERDYLASPIAKNDTNTKVANFTYTSEVAPIAINDLAPWFYQHNSKMTVRRESEFQFNDISNSNLIFIGHYTRFHNAKKLFLNNSKVFSTQNDGFIYTHKKETISYKNSFIDMKRTDYTMVSFMHLDNDRKALFIVSNHDIGVIALCKKLSNKEQLKDFCSHLPNKEQNFNALFKVSGLQRTNLGCELIHLELVP